MLAAAAAVTGHPDKAADDEEDWPAHLYEPSGEDTQCTEQEIHTYEYRKDREHFVVRTVAGLSFAHLWVLILILTFHFINYDCSICHADLSALCFIVSSCI